MSYAGKIRLTREGKRLLHTRKLNAYLTIVYHHQVHSAWWDGGSLVLTYWLRGNGLMPVDVLVEMGTFGGKPSTPHVFAWSFEAVRPLFDADDLRGTEESY